MNQNTSNIAGYSQTQTQTPSIPAARLVLHGSRPRRQVRWSEDTIDNEHMNKKKTKICCIFTKTPAFGESSSEEEDSDSSSSSSSSDNESDSENCCNHKHHHHQSSKPNAYERQPRYTKHDKNIKSDQVQETSG